MPNALSILFSLPGFVLCMLAYGEVDVAAENEELEGLRRLTEQDDAEGQFNLGVIYDTGEGVPEDDAGGEVVPRPPTRVTPRRNSTWASLYDNGEGVPEDDVRTYGWCNRAAEQGYEHAVKARDSLRERNDRQANYAGTGTQAMPSFMAWGMSGSPALITDYRRS